jgi:hypothetical protein
VDVLLDAVLITGIVTGHSFHEANVFLGWFTTANPEMRSAISGNQIGDFCVENEIASSDFAWFLEALDTKVLIGRPPSP